MDNTKAAIAVGFLLIFTVVVIVSGISTQHKERKAGQAKTGTNVLDKTHIGNGAGTKQITSIEYKGHKYILYYTYGGGNMLHDPDCTCNREHAQ